MMLQDLHSHSRFDDGANTLEDMAQAAQAAGLSALGCSGHSPLPYDNNWAIPPERLDDYRAEVRRLQRAYAGKLAIYCGLEFDITSQISLTGFDYVIGSVHHLPIDGHVTVDESAAVTRACLRERFGGDAAKMERAFYGEYDKVAENPAVDIVGHFDLIAKFDEPRTVFHAAPDCAVRAMETLVRAGKIFEVNTGAIYRRYRQTPYPSAALLRQLRAMDGKITITSDAHATGAVGFAFAQALQLAKDCGFDALWQFDGSAFAPIGI